MGTQARPGVGGAGRTTSDAFQTPLGYQQITGMTSAASLTVPEGATHAIIQAEAQNVRYRHDGTSPTASVGMILTAGTQLVDVSDLAAVEFIEVASGAKLNVEYFSV